MSEIDKLSLNRLYSARWPYAILFSLIFLLTHLRQNSHTNYNCEICSDKAGYYMYLPATVQLGFHAAQYPKHFDADHGNGFYLDTTTNKVITKFTCGVSMLQAPFYLTGSLVASVFSIPDHPYSRYYLLFINIGIAFYCTLGLYFLKKWLGFYVNQRAATLTMLVTFFGTHLYYYTLDESLMSHTYSFFLLSGSLYAMKLWLSGKQQKYFILYVLAIAIAVLVRPTNVLFVLIGFFLDARSRSDLVLKFSAVFTARNIVASLIIFCIVFLPQVIYWNFAFGKFFIWSYQGEGFYNWSDPWFRTVWFSPQSGLFPYTPILLFTLAVATAGIIKRKANAILVITTFLLVSYMCAAWSNPWFGDCNFGKRPFVEYLPILMLPVAWVIHGFHQYKPVMRASIIICLAGFVAYNLTLFFGFDTCYTGEGWDWSAFAGMFGKGF